MFTIFIVGVTYKQTYLLEAWQGQPQFKKHKSNACNQHVKYTKLTCKHNTDSLELICYSS